MQLNNVIIPALQDNNWVICDSFIDSTMAYQGAGLGVPYNYMHNITERGCEGINPN